MHDVVGRMNVLFVTLDCLRYDTARRCLEQAVFAPGRVRNRLCTSVNLPVDFKIRGSP